MHAFVYGLPEVARDGTGQVWRSATPRDSSRTGWPPLEPGHRGSRQPCSPPSVSSGPDDDPGTHRYGGLPEPA
eukprot:4532282-Lingulodinium_polyedra.AAC.1